MKIEWTKGGKPGQVKDLLRIADHPLLESIAIEGDRTLGHDTTLTVRIKDVPEEEQHVFTQALAIVTDGYLRRRPTFETDDHGVITATIPPAPAAPSQTDEFVQVGIGSKPHNIAANLAYILEDAPAPLALRHEGRGGVLTKEERQELGDYLMNIGSGVDPEAPENKRTR